MLGAFGANEEARVSDFAIAWGAEGLADNDAVESCGFGLGFGRAVSLLTRTDAGTCSEAPKETLLMQTSKDGSVNHQRKTELKIIKQK